MPQTKYIYFKSGSLYIYESENDDNNIFSLAAIESAESCGNIEVNKFTCFHKHGVDIKATETLRKLLSV